MIARPGADCAANTKKPAPPASWSPSILDCSISSATATRRRIAPTWGWRRAEPRSGARHHAGEIAHVGRALEPVDRLDDGRRVSRIEHRGGVPLKLLRGFLPGERIARRPFVGTGADRVALPSALDDDLSGPEAGCLV